MKILYESTHLRESLNETIKEEDRIQALADYLGIDPGEISNTYDYEYETPEGDYLVVTEDEAWNLARQDIISIFEDLGLEAFTENFREWIIENALDVNEFESVVEDAMYDYIEEIREVEDDTYGTELIASMIDAGCIDEEDLDDPEFDVDDHTEDYLSYLMDGISDDVGYVDWCIDNYDEDWVTNYAIENDLFDMDTIVEECIDVDGIAHFIARYDGEEIELEDGLYAYRTN